MTHNASTAMGSLVSTQLCQMSSNLQRIPQQSVSFQDGSLDRPATKRRRLELTAKSPTRGSSYPPISITTTLGDASKLCAETHQSKGSLFEPATGPIRYGPFRREIKIDLLELRENTKEFDELCSLPDADFPTRCMLEIYVAKPEDTQNGVRLKCGEELWIDQQIGTIQTLCDDYGHSTTNILLPTPFLIPAEALSVKRSIVATETAGQRNRLDLADQFLVKIWLEALRSGSRWPPLELQSRVEEGGKMQKWLHDGTFANSDIRILCKGELLLDGRASSCVDMFLKLGGLQVQTSCTLQVKVQYSLPLHRNLRPGGTNFQNIKTSDDVGVSNDTTSSSITIKTRHLSISGAQDITVDDYESVERSSHQLPTLPRLVVPHSKSRICHPVTKNILVSGEELDAIDDGHEMSWRTAKHVATIENHADLNFDTRDYIIRWNSFMVPMILSSSCYMPRVLFAFAMENKDWFAERRTRVMEFSLHATSLRLRGSIDMECFSECVNLLGNYIETQKKLAEKNGEAARRISRGADNAENFMDRNLIDGIASDEEVLEFRKASGEPAPTNLQTEVMTDVEPSLEDAKDEVTTVEAQMDQEMLDDATGQSKSDEDVVLGDFEPKDDTCETQKPAAGKDMDSDDPDGEESYEDASEEIKMIDLNDYFDAEEGESTPEQAYYFQTYWQSISQRWPRIKLHHPENFRKACVIAAIAIFQGFPSDNIDRLIALHIHHCPNESIQDLVHMYYHTEDVAPELPGVCMTEHRLHVIMWEAGRHLCESWLTDVYRADDGARRTVREAVDTATNAPAWDELWDCVYNECCGF